MCELVFLIDVLEYGFIFAKNLDLCFYYISECNYISRLNVFSHSLLFVMIFVCIYST